MKANTTFKGPMKSKEIFHREACQWKQVLQCRQLSSCRHTMHTQERKYGLNTHCMSLFFFRRKSPLLSYNTEGEEWQQENALEGSARCCALPWPGWRRWVVTTHIAGWHKSLGAETPHREIGMRTGLQGTEPGKCIFVSISSLLWFPAKCGRHTCTTGHAPASHQLRQRQMLRREPQRTAPPGHFRRATLSCLCSQIFTVSAQRV